MFLPNVPAVVARGTFSGVNFAARVKRTKHRLSCVAFATHLQMRLDLACTEAAFVLKLGKKSVYSPRFVCVHILALAHFSFVNLFVLFFSL